MGGYLLLKDDFEARIRLLAHEEAAAATLRDKWALNATVAAPAL